MMNPTQPTAGPSIFGVAFGNWISVGASGSKSKISLTVTGRGLKPIRIAGVLLSVPTITYGCRQHFKLTARVRAGSVGSIGVSSGTPYHAVGPRLPIEYRGRPELAPIRGSFFQRKGVTDGIADRPRRLRASAFAPATSFMTFISFAR